MKKITIVVIGSIVIVQSILVLLNSCKKDNNDNNDNNIIPNKPIEITTDSVTEITPTSARLYGNIISTGEGSITYGFCWSNFMTFPSYTNSEWSVVWFGTTGSFSFVIEELTPGMKYYVRAVANKSFEEYGEVYGATISFTTTGNIVGDIVFNQDLTYETLTDIEGNNYKTVQIGNQTWMAENLKTTKYNDSTDIPNETSYSSWNSLNSPGYCWFVNDPDKYKATYGALYNWHAVSTGKLCPTGWHVPTYTEWTTLIAYINNSSNKLKETGNTHWVEPNSGTNHSGFTTLPGGSRLGPNGPPTYHFWQLGYRAYFWSSTEDNDWQNMAFYLVISNYSMPELGADNIKNGFSVRCIND